MIVRTLPDLILSGKPINRPSLYETYLLGEIKRQKITKRRELILSEEVRFSLLERLAVDFYSRRDSAITFSGASDLMAKVIEPPKGELEAYTREFLTCSFLIRKADEYRFSHNSIMDFLVARSLDAEIRDNKVEVFGRSPLPLLVADFLSDLSPSSKRLWELVEETRSGGIINLPYAGGNAITLLCLQDKNALAGKDLSGAVLVGANFATAVLHGTNLEGCCLDHCNISGASYPRSITNARLLDTVMRCFVLTRHLKQRGKGDDLFQKALDEVQPREVRMPDLLSALPVTPSSRSWTSSSRMQPG
jgi:hypothetical protein